MYRANTIVGQKPATLATGDDLAHDENVGVTNPNLHRRIESDPVSGNEYSIGIYGTHSYRTTTIKLHDEDSETSEVP